MSRNRDDCADRVAMAWEHGYQFRVREERSERRAAARLASQEVDGLVRTGPVGASAGLPGDVKGEVEVHAPDHRPPAVRVDGHEPQ